jgi:hypothetical protein
LWKFVVSIVQLVEELKAEDTGTGGTESVAAKHWL